MAASKKHPAVGPRGGLTSIYAPTGLTKKAMYLYRDQWERLRKMAFEEDRNASDITREALLAYFEERKRTKVAKAPKGRPVDSPPAPPAEDHGSM